MIVQTLILIFIFAIVSFWLSNKMFGKDNAVREEIGSEKTKQKAEHSYNVDEILKLKNKDFVFECLYILNKKSRKEDIEKLTNLDFCKNKFCMYYPVLQEVKFEINDEKIFMDNCGYRRYYPDVITLFDKKYIVCNDWFYNNKSNPRDTRTPFVNWVVQ